MACIRVNYLFTFTFSTYSQNTFINLLWWGKWQDLKYQYISIRKCGITLHKIAMFILIFLFVKHENKNLNNISIFSHIQVTYKDFVRSPFNCMTQQVTGMISTSQQSTTFALTRCWICNIAGPVIYFMTSKAGYCNWHLHIPIHIV